MRRRAPPKGRSPEDGTPGWEARRRWVSPASDTHGVQLSSVLFVGGVRSARLIGQPYSRSPEGAGKCGFVRRLRDFRTRVGDLWRNHKRTLEGTTAQVEMTDLQRHDGKFVIVPKRPTETPEHLTVAGSWPHDGPCRPDEVALLLIDFQSDFIDADGYLAKVGGDIKPAQEAVMKVKPILEAARSEGVRVFHTREGHRPWLADV